MMVKPQRGVKINPFHSINKNLEGAWLFNENSGKTIADSSPHHNNGELKNGNTVTDWVTTEDGGGIKFTTGNNIVECGTIDNLKNRPISAMIWGDFVGSGGFHSAVSYTIKAGDGGWSFHSLSSFGSSMSFSINPFVDINSTFTPPSGMSVIGVSVTGTDITFFKDGAFDTKSDSTSIAQTPDTLGIGAQNRNSTIVDPLDGTITRVLVWSRAISNEEFSQLYRDPSLGFFVDDKPNLFSVAAGGGVSRVPFISAAHRIINL